MTPEERKLAIEEETLSLDKQRFTLEKARSEREQAFLHRNSGALIAAAVALTGAYSSYQISRLQRNIDATRVTQEAQKAAATEAQAKDELSLKLNQEALNRRVEMLQFVEKHYDVFNGPANPQRLFLLNLLAVTFRNANGYDEVIATLKNDKSDPVSAEQVAKAEANANKTPLVTGSVILRTPKTLFSETGGQLAFLQPNDLAIPAIQAYFLDGKGTLPERLDPSKPYLAIGLDSRSVPIDRLRKNHFVTVKNNKSSATVDALLVDYFPKRIHDHAVAASKGLIESLKIEAGDEVSVFLKDAE